MVPVDRFLVKVQDQISKVKKMIDANACVACI